jgi:hypothetical protein
VTVGAAEAADQGLTRRAGYRRSAGTPRGEARRRELLDRVVDDLAVNGLVDFSLRRAARAGGTRLVRRVRQLPARADRQDAGGVRRLSPGMFGLFIIPLDQPARLAEVIREFTQR